MTSTASMYQSPRRRRGSPQCGKPMRMIDMASSKLLFDIHGVCKDRKVVLPLGNIQWGHTSSKRMTAYGRRRTASVS